MRRIEDQGFLLLLFVVTLAFAWILQPFYGAVLWAIVVAVIFAPADRRILRSVGGRETLAASITVLLIIAMVLLPLAIIATSLAREAAGLYAKIQSGNTTSPPMSSGFSMRCLRGRPAGWIASIWAIFRPCAKR